MNKSLSFLVFLVFLTMAGCGAYVSPDLMYKLQDDVRDLKRDVSALKEGQDKRDTLTEELGSAGTAKLSDVEVDLRKEIASMKADIEGLRGEISHFQGFIDETKYQIRQDQLTTNERIGVNETRLLELEGKITSLMTTKPVQDSYQKEQRETGMGAVRTDRQGEEKKEEVLTSERVIRSTERVPLQGPEDLYDYSLGLIKASQFREARKSLEEFISTYPNNRLMPNVYYWRGETFYAEKDFESAAITFQEVIDRYPDSPKAPDALYKQGLCFFNMKDPISARAAFNLLLSKYPTSIAAGKAKSKLSEIGEKGG